MRSRDQKYKRLVKLVDDTNCLVELVIWGDFAKDIVIEKDTIVAFQDLRIKDFNGKGLTMSNGS